MKFNLAARSILLFGVCMVTLTCLTLAETRLGVMSLTAQRIITLLILVFPAAAGCLFGVRSLARKEGRPWLASIGILFNGLFALFHILIVLFAG